MSTKRLFCGTMFYASIIFEIFAYKYDFFVQLVQSILKYNRGIYMQNVLLRLREVQPSLSSTERQIAQFILENPDETTTLTIRDLARRSFSSPSSVVRICRVIGFQGYKELRHALTLELATLGENGSHREKDITPQDSLQEIVDKVTHKNIQSLLDTQRLLLLDELEQCVELIANARTVLLFGIGSSLCVAKDTYLKFLRLDKPCVVNEDSHSQLLQALRNLRRLCLIYRKLAFIPFFLLATHHRKGKALSRALPPLVVLCTLYWAFCLLYLSCKRKLKSSVPFLL